MSLLTPSSTPSLACWLSHLFTFWHINIESTLCLVVVVVAGWRVRGRVGSVPHMISDSVHGVETCMVKNLAPAPDQMPSLSLQRVRGYANSCYCRCIARLAFMLFLNSLTDFGFHFWNMLACDEPAKVFKVWRNAFHSVYYSWKEIGWQFAPQPCVSIGVTARNSWPAKHQIGGSE